MGFYSDRPGNGGNRISAHKVKKHWWNPWKKVWKSWTIYGNDGNDIINGGGKGDSLYGGSGYDNIHGKNGHDVIAGGAHSDWLSGGNGDDIIYGGSKYTKSTSYTGDSGDWIYGGRGNDTIYGQKGNDWLSGDSGINYLYGGSGADTFVVGRSSLGDGNHQVIKDFNSAQGDKLVFYGVNAIRHVGNLSGRSYLDTYFLDSRTNDLLAIIPDKVVSI